jgi:hypothetical protein
VAVPGPRGRQKWSARWNGVFYARRMSSDAFADLGLRLEHFAQALRELHNANKRPAPGSVADREARGEPYADEWGRHPSRDIFATVVLTSWSCADHLTGTAILLQAKRCIPSLFTLARGGAEAAVTACYLCEAGIDPLERVRRNMNCHLDGLCQELNMLRKFSHPGAQARIDQHEKQIEAVKQTALKRGFAFKPASRHLSAYIGEKPKSVMELMNDCAARTPGIGALTYQMFSGVAHAKLHGLSRFLVMNGEPPRGSEGGVSVEMNITAGEVAQQLFATMVCASTLANQMRYFLGWDTEQLDAAATRMHATWARIAGAPYDGPILR